MCRALELRPGYVRAMANLGIAYANQNMHQDAARLYVQTLVKNPHAEHIWSYLRLSLAALRRNDLVQATMEIPHRDPRAILQDLETGGPHDPVSAADFGASEQDLWGDPSDPSAGAAASASASPPV